MEHLTFIDMFAGIGGFRSGMEQAGHKCVGWIEWDKYARQSYRAIYNTEGEYNAKDIRQVQGSDLPDSDVWCFGFPCQDVSNAGKQTGLLNGKRSGLFFEVVRLLQERARNKEALPKILFIENVKNLLSTLPKSSLKTEKEYILLDILEDQVPEKYFLSSDKVEQLIKNSKSK